MSQEDEKKRVDSLYMHYREQAGNALSSVVIISAPLIGILVRIAKPELGNTLNVIFYLFGIIPLFVSIYSGIQAKYLYFLGYQKYAQSEFEFADANSVTKEENKLKKQNAGAKLFEDSNIHFENADKHTNRCRGAFLIGLFTIFIIYSLHFLNINCI